MSMYGWKPKPTDRSVLQRTYNPHQFYDQGWNARCRGEPYEPTASRDWKDGWKDADEAPEAERGMCL